MNNKMDLGEKLKFIEKISPFAKDYVKDGFANNKVEILYSIITEENEGVFLMVDNDDCCIFYASFLNESNIEEISKVITNKINEYISKANSKEICFNVYGDNTKIIKLVKELGFTTDMEGYHMEFSLGELPKLKECNLTHNGFEDSMIKEFVELFDSAYYKLNVENGWQVNCNAIYGKEFYEELNDLNKHGEVHSFWLENELVGAYIFKNNYIADLVVKPIFQNKGYGSYILTHCIRNMRLNKEIKSVRLRVVKTNVGAKNLYEMYGFTQIASFAEHTYG